MNLVYKILASHLLIIFFASKASVETSTWGALGEQVYWETPIKCDNNIEDIRLEKNQVKIAQFKGCIWNSQEKGKYYFFDNGTLKIEHLENSDSGNYSVNIYNTTGKHVFEGKFVLQIQERVSEPTISWDCKNKTLTCRVANGTGTKLELSLNGNKTSNDMKMITSKFYMEKTKFWCTASNNINKKTKQGNFDCSEKGLDLSLLLGICGAGAVALLFVALLIFYISRRKQSTPERNDEVEIRALRVPTKDRGQKPNRAPGSAPNPAAQLPPPPGHHPQAPGQRLQAPHPQQKVPLPPVPPHKGPPLPRPRAQQKPPRGPKEHA
ncbi:T-cell surface antigen CD2 [Sorex araneus]|uniref:T-cell surface antigen CD2 n=1 Tax=Sorex araneus TaxID=42254 RepID=UPI002433ADD6|nr:T-cell surface antigen CD2 [Sorex araneus]